MCESQECVQVQICTIESIEGDKASFGYANLRDSGSLGAGRGRPVVITVGLDAEV